MYDDFLTCVGQNEWCLYAPLHSCCCEPQVQSLSFVLVARRLLEQMVDLPQHKLRSDYPQEICLCHPS